MAVLVYILGRSGTGKSYSMRKFPKDELAVLNVQGKILPFRGSAEIEQTITDDSDELVEGIREYSKKYKSIVVDDFQYVMANEFMRRVMERGYDKFSEIGRHAWDIANEVQKLPQDVIVYVMCHTDVDSEGMERLKTIGKLLDDKIFLEGMSTIVLKTVVSDGKYAFVTQNNGRDTVKSPADMFPSYAIDNDLYYVDQKIREYYGLGATMSAEELVKADSEAAQDGSPDDGKKKKRRRRSEDPDVQAVKEKDTDAVLNIAADDPREEVPFEEVDMSDFEKLPRRKKRDTAEMAQETLETLETVELPESTGESVTEDEKPVRRRRRRG